MSRYTEDVEMTDEKYKFIYEMCSENTIYRIPRRGKFALSYGYDHACGWFHQWFPKDELAESELENLQVEECAGGDSVFDGFTGAELGFLLNLFNLNKDHADLAYLDYAF